MVSIHLSADKIFKIRTHLENGFLNRNLGIELQWTEFGNRLPYFSLHVGESLYRD